MSRIRSHCFRAVRGRVSANRKPPLAFKGQSVAPGQLITNVACRQNSSIRNPISKGLPMIVSVSFPMTIRGLPGS